MRFVATKYLPTSTRSGDNPPSILRGKNMFVRGRGEDTYLECVASPLDLSETITPVAISGTISFSAASKTITGVSTAFTTELHYGQILCTILGEIIIVDEITDDTHFTAQTLPLSTGAGVAAYRMPILFEVGKKRGSLLTGNALEFDRGTILAVGSGVLRINGTALTSSLTATRQAQIALYDYNTGNYTIQELGFSSVPIGITVSAATAPAAKTFVDADVTVATDNIHIVGHGFNNGQKVVLTTSGTLPAGLSLLTNYFVIRIGADDFKLATTLANTVGTPVPVNITAAAGGGTHTVTPISKAMPAGDRSIRIAKASTKLGTPSFGNPGEKITVTLTAGQQIAIAFPAMDSNGAPTNPHDAWRIYASPFGGSAATATANAQSGAWYYVTTVTSSDLGGTSGGTYYLEYLDAEIDALARLITFDNDKPPQAEFVGTVAGYPVLISCQGKPTAANPTGTSPGASIVPFKVSNIAAAPLVLDNGSRNEVPLSPPETIIGFYMAAGRLYLLTANTLQIAVFTQDADFPVATRPFWKTGFKNPNAVCFVNGRLYGFTSQGAMRSVADGEEGAEEHAFAADVEEITKNWSPERVRVVHDPVNECVCFIYSAAEKNASTYWVSHILCFMLRNETWSPLMVIESTTQDMVITGAATVNNKFEFIAGGRDGVGGVTAKTYRFDAGSASVAYSAGWQFTDAGSEDRPKTIKRVMITGKFTSANYGLHGAEAGEVIDVAALEAGNSGSKTGAVTIPASSSITTYASSDIRLDNQMVFTPCIAGTWDGTGLRDRIDEITTTVLVKGSRK